MARLTAVPVSIVLAVAASFALSGQLPAQCVPPAGTYSIDFDVPPSIPATCPGAVIPIAVLGSTGGGGPIQAFGFTATVSGAGTILGVASGYPLSAGSWFSSVVNAAGDSVSAIGAKGISAPGLTVLAVIDYALIPTATPGTITLSFTGSTPFPGGLVPINDLVVATCDVVAPVLSTPGITIATIPCPGNFLRGDCNNNGLVYGVLGDVIAVLEFVYLGTFSPTCLNACDSNDDEAVNITDAVALLAWMFSGGPAPPAPTPFVGLAFLGACGPDPTPGGLGCGAGICP